MKKVRVLAIDGGGIRGIIPATVIAYIEQQLIEITGNTNARIADYFDLIAGTSTGGLLTGFYLTPPDHKEPNGPSTKYSAQEALNFYLDHGYDIFNACKRNTWFGLRQLFNATEFSPKGMDKALHDLFGEGKLNDLVKPCLITTYDMARKASFFFNNSVPHLDKKQDFYVRDVLRSTSAAPTYFPPAHITNLATQEKMVNIDGGVFANNPAMCAYALCGDSEFTQVSYPKAENLLVLSLGTGGGQFKLPDLAKSNSWGVIDWAKGIPSIMMDGSIDAVDYQMQNIYYTLAKEHHCNYKRIDVPLAAKTYSTDMSDASPKNLKALQKAGEATIKAALQGSDKAYGLQEFIQQLVDNAPTPINNTSKTPINSVAAES